MRPKGHSKTLRGILVLLIFVSGVVSVLFFQAVTGTRINPDIYGPEYFVTLAESTSPITDKITTHRYDIMYGKFLFPFIHRHILEHNRKIKFFEIGLGCDMVYGPGASIFLWKNIFKDTAEIWSAEVDSKCVEKFQSTNSLRDVNVLTGDQGNDKHLSQWLKTSGGCIACVMCHVFNVISH
jgi:hypothetical protein